VDLISFSLNEHCQNLMSPTQRVLKILIAAPANLIRAPMLHSRSNELRAAFVFSEIDKILGAPAHGIGTDRNQGWKMNARFFTRCRAAKYPLADSAVG
jgi:hypothetical protein